MAQPLYKMLLICVQSFTIFEIKIDECPLKWLGWYRAYVKHCI